MEIVLLIILIVLVVALFVVSYMKKKKYNAELGQMREELKIGDKVMTDTGVVGEVVDSYIEDEYKYFVLKSGKGSNVGYFTVHANAIYYVFGKEEKQTQEKKVSIKVNSPETAEKPATEQKANKAEQTEEQKANKAEQTEEKKEEKEPSESTTKDEKKQNKKSKK